ncbi:hypothetical protein PTUN_a2693 [Pseudoalteromonas tunicata]|nr:hypothetical protein PTUN_a2693 [Pseudoalteromonas tunicata]
MAQFRFATQFSQALSAPYWGVEAVEFLFFKKNRLFSGFQMH